MKLIDEENSFEFKLLSYSNTFLESFKNLMNYDLTWKLYDRNRLIMEDEGLCFLKIWFKKFNWKLVKVGFKQFLKCSSLEEKNN